MIFSILIIVVCILLILVVLVQNSKGGGIQSQFGAATQIMGVKRGTEFIEKATWGLAMVLIVLSILMAPKSSMTQTSNEDNGSIAKKKAQTAVQQQAPVQQTPVQQMPPSEKPK
ncbi:MAG: preprotein translocase subunit SecG [Bacteroidetes bacterium]|nr:preprotein translocase subunit SecG [Bacteroidota bacterium]